MVQEHPKPIVQPGPPLGSAPGYGDVTENVVGEQGPSEPPNPHRVEETRLYKEELLPEEKGTSLDEGGAG